MCSLGYVKLIQGWIGGQKDGGFQVQHPIAIWNQISPVEFTRKDAVDRRCAGIKNVIKAADFHMRLAFAFVIDLADGKVSSFGPGTMEGFVNAGAHQISL